MDTNTSIDYSRYGIPNMPVKRQEHNKTSIRKGQHDIDPSLVLGNESLRIIDYFSEVRMEEDQIPKRK